MSPENFSDENSDADFSVLSESDIAALATPKVMTRGRVLFDDGALEELARRGEEISALCAGSEEESYALHARLSSHGVKQTRCSCAYDYDGICKHLVALLLAWAHTPEAFETLEETPAAPNAESNLLRELKSRERDELAVLIAQLVVTEPKLKGVVKRLLQTRLSDGELNKVQRAVESIMKKIMRGGYDANFSAIGRDLKFHLRAAASLEATRPTDAGRVYAAILEGMMSVGQDPFQWDEGRILIDVSEACSRSLAASASLKSTPSARRGEWITVLARAFVFDLKLGGYDFAGAAVKVLEKVGNDEWVAVEAILDAAFTPRKAPQKMMVQMKTSAARSESFDTDEFTNCWIRESIIQLKANRLRKMGDGRGSRLMLLESGTPQQRVKAHLENRDFDAAVAVADQHYPRYAGLLREFVEQLNQVEEWPRARDFAHRHNLQKWLAAEAARRGEDDAFDLNLNLFQSTPCLQQWRVVMELAPENRRAAVRTQLWEFLEKRKKHAIQFDITLSENEITAALALWEKLNRSEREPRHNALADAAANAQPNEAFLLWDELAHSLIAQRSRDAYRLAAKALKRGKQVLEKHDLAAQWQEFIADLRAQYPTLRALKEELDRAKL